MFWFWNTFICDGRARKKHEGIQSQSSDTSSMYHGIGNALQRFPYSLLLPWQTPLNRFAELVFALVLTASFWCILWLGLFRVLLVLLVVVLLYHHHELHARAASASFAYRKGLAQQRGAKGGEGRFVGRPKVPTTERRVQIIMHVFVFISFVLLHFIQISYRAVFTFISSASICNSQT